LACALKVRVKIYFVLSNDFLCAVLDFIPRAFKLLEFGTNAEDSKGLLRRKTGILFPLQQLLPTTKKKCCWCRR
jgi:hypothetical protein